jgi:hypothetical protein
MELTIEELTKLKIKEHFKNGDNKKYYKVTLEDLINLSIKVVKVMKREL